MLPADDDFAAAAADEVGAMPRLASRYARAMAGSAALTPSKNLDRISCRTTDVKHPRSSRQGSYTSPLSQLNLSTFGRIN